MFPAISTFSPQKKKEHQTLYCVIKNLAFPREFLPQHLDPEKYSLRALECDKSISACVEALIVQQYDLE